MRHLYSCSFVLNRKTKNGSVKDVYSDAPVRKLQCWSECYQLWILSLFNKVSVATSFPAQTQQYAISNTIYTINNTVNKLFSLDILTPLIYITWSLFFCGNRKVSLLIICSFWSTLTPLMQKMFLWYFWLSVSVWGLEASTVNLSSKWRSGDREKGLWLILSGCL